MEVLIGSLLAHLYIADPSSVLKMEAAGTPETFVNIYQSTWLDVCGRIILKCILEKENGVIWTGLILLSIGSSGGLL
jgi:hypothetical protein